MWRYWIALISLAVVWIVVQGSVAGSRVYELSDRFLDIYKKDSRSWLVKFYAPWCHYCRQLEPVYMQVAQTLTNEGSEVVVGRIDCTRFTAVTTTFPVKGFPTILFIHPDYIVEYDGDRTKEEITDFARRLSGPPIRPLLDCKSVDESLWRHGVFFLHIGHPISDIFTKTAGKYRSLNWFYHLNSTACPGLTQPGSYVIKGKLPDNKIIERFQDTLPLAEPLSTSNGEESSISKSPSMNEWLRKEMFPQFGKVTSGNFNRLLKTGKILILSVVEELIPVERLASGKHQEFRDLLEAIALTYEDRKPFIFGWTSSLDLVNSITLHSIRTLPSFVVINSSDLTYSVREGSIPPQDIIDILISLGRGEFDDFSGGNSWWTRIRRALFDALVSFVNMYQGNPVLTILLFGLPLSFFAFIIYSAFFSDMLDAPDDEEEELVEDHEKKD